ncbi:MAG: class I SAM-dependent methyltransferase [Thaumarchaeota archaeon]|nr:class I SAM-dependent methyltransferase [Nitrososphaerota archaeon]
MGLLKGGVSSATGFDLSPKMVEAASALASESGFSSTASFSVGDGATSALPTSDLVILDSVLCCYPDVSELVDNSSSAARRVYAISLPDSRRRLTKILRPFLFFQPAFLRGKKFRFFVPSADKIISQLKAKGFTKVYDSAAGFTWSVLLFAAPRKQPG